MNRVGSESVNALVRPIDGLSLPLAIRSNQSSVKLKGWKVAIKANIATTSPSKTLDQVNPVTSCASKVLSDYVSPFQATVANLIESNGGEILVDKANMDEFGMGSYNVHSIYGPVKNPRDLSRVSGGSSGGSAAAVASGSCRIALGTDTGGSVRLPASYCGVVGFKPSYGRFSRWGVVSYASSLDTVGILGKTVEDCEKVYDVLDWRDEKDPTSLAFNTFPQISREFKNITVGIPAHVPSILPELTLCLYSNMIEKLESKGVKIVPVTLDNHKHALGAYYTIASAEASSNLARFDGIRYGRLDENNSGPENVRNMFGDAVKKRIMLGSFVLGSNAYSSYFSQSQKIRRLIQISYNDIFKQAHPITPSINSARKNEKVDFILTPASSNIAPTLEKVAAGELVDEFMDDVMTVPASLAGLPALVVPSGFIAGNMGVGMQIIGQFGDDKRLFRIGQEMES
ncbi:Trimeric GatFAB AmidoTransferase(AdT) complex subunit [Physocladia obscura]|uniref:Glutamyl-tRNA(Gln) amidotransferase subunit A, mitochondrial n=1 Tax=Physocladia obscura TaxID=109957 RepID=A0AAD5XG48_9FUNG|nr:Trimeric GatFAB AmidoTransferase(AdT) complex subunit [Physocladia obscura]